MQKRDSTIDILRGMAIFTMIAANMAAHSFMEPHPFAFRLYGSFAAPTFIFLAGMMVSYTAFLKKHPLKYYFVRGSATLIVAALIDYFLWGVIPFTTFDVLYLIGLAMPLIHLFLFAKRWLQATIITLLFALTPLMQIYFGYIDTPVEPNIISDLNFKIVLHQLFVDGWFPLFPWLGVSFLGAFFGHMRVQHSPEIISKPFLISGLFFFTVGITSWCLFKPTLITREGYSELFYPPTLFYLLTFIGLILILLSLLYKIRHQKIFYFFSNFGRSSLLVYILHTVFIVTIFNVFFEACDLTMFAVLYLSHAAVLWLIVFFVQKIKKENFPFILRFILGS